jgi:two-component system response regulator NreC
VVDLGLAAPSRQIIRLLLVDDHVVFRAGLRGLLDKQPGFAVVGEAGTGEEAVARVKEACPDVVLMDLAMPGEGGLAATRQIARLGLGVKVLVLTALPRDPQLLEVFEAGALGFVEKISAVDELTRAIRTVNTNQLFLCPDAAQLIVLERYRIEGRVGDEKASLDRLSECERRVLALLAQGYTVREIAGKRAISPKTVRACRTRVRDRLGLRHRPDLVGFALRMGLLERH